MVKFVNGSAKMQRCIKTTGISCSDILKVLAYVIHDGRDGGRVDGSLRLKRLDVVQRIGVKQLRKSSTG